MGVFQLIALVLVFSLLFGTQPVHVSAKTSRLSSPSEALLAPADLYHLPKFVKQLASHRDKVSSYVWSRLSPSTQQMVTSFKFGEPTDKLKGALVADVNVMLRDPSFYSVETFSTLKLRGTTKRLLQKPPTGERVIYLNRAVFENAYPGRVKIGLVGKVFEDEADNAQAQADDAQSQADQSQAEADQSQGEQQSAAQQQADEQQSQADQAQGQADNQAELAQGAQGAAQAADKGWTWGDFWANIVGGAVGGFLGGLTGGIVGGVVGALGGAVGGALVSVLGYFFGSVPLVGITFRALPERALD